MKDDVISRQAAIKDAESWVAVDEYEKHLQKGVIEWLKEFPSAHPEHNQNTPSEQTKTDKLGGKTGETYTDTISRKAAIDIIEDFPHGGVWNVESMEEMVYRIKQLPPAQTELEDKILAIGYTGEEGHIYIGGRLFAVRELAQ